MSARFTLAQIAEMTGGRVARGAPDLALSAIAVDTRRLIEPGALFWALRGPNFDGHDFLDGAARGGAVAAVVERGRAESAPRGLALVEVDDAIRALQRAGARWRALRSHCIVVGVTGSNGKTAVKEMLAAAASGARSVWRSPGSFNSQIGVPLSLLGIEPAHEIAVIEAGISRPGEMKLLEAMIRPDAGVLVSIGDAHAAGLGDRLSVARQKSALFARLKEGAPLVYLATNPEAVRALDGSRARTIAARVLKGDEVARRGELSVTGAAWERGWSFHVTWPSGGSAAFALHESAIGAHQLENAAVAIGAAWALGVPEGSIRRGLAAWRPAPMRLAIHQTPGGVTLLHDAYSADPSSTRAALDALSAYPGGGHRIAVLGDMLDLGEGSERAHAELGRRAARAGIDAIVATGRWARAILAGAGGEAARPVVLREAAGLGEVRRAVREIAERGDVVLVKASGAIGLDVVAAEVLESVHPTRLVVDLDAIRHNYHAIRRRAGGAPLAAVVKGFGYGNDPARVAAALAAEGVAALVVAYPDEAAVLREAGLETPILVTNPTEGEADKIVALDLIAVVAREQTALAIAHAAKQAGRTIAVQIEIETGMRRSGVLPERAPALAALIARTDAIELGGALTHLAAADDPAEDEFTRAQLARFDAALGAMRAAGYPAPLAHAANTAAAWRLPEARYDMVRAGLGLYGVHASQGLNARRALSLSTRVRHLAALEAGESVGYGRSWYAARDSMIATIACGYHDGLPRSMSNGGEVLIGGRRCPIVGRVCMDAAMVDVTDLGGIEVGDEVVIFGSQGDETIEIAEIAARDRTIEYEILSRLPARVRRVFVRTW